MGVILGVIVALIMILGGNFLEGGHAGGLLALPSAMIVIGGTIGSVIVQYPFPTIVAALKACAASMKGPEHDPAKLVDEIVDYANRARRDGILALEKVSESASDPFLRKALMMAVDGVDSQTLRETLEVAISEEEHHGEDSGKVMEAFGGYAPTIGIIGAVLGLIHVMSNLSDINAVGKGIAGAFVATIYGVAFANIVCLPMGTRLKNLVRQKALVRELTLTGVLAIQAGLNPKLVRERLSQFLHDHAHEKKK